MGNILRLHKKFKEEQEVTCEEEEEEFTCEICMESYLPVDKKFKNIYSGNNKKKEKQNKECASKHRFCKDCIAKYIEVKINDGGTSVIKCPGINCNVEFNILSCRDFIDVSSKVFVRWCDLLCESAILANFSHHLRRAHCPGCFELVLNECRSDDGITRTTCPCCKKPFCFCCVIPLTDEQTHACSRQWNKEIQFNDRNDLLFVESVARQGWTRCPYCARFVERISGCATIYCRCGNRFCYRCGRKLPLSGHCNCESGAIRRREEPYLEMLSMFSVFTGVIVVFRTTMFVLGKK